jgi:hypothetical protein
MLGRRLTSIVDNQPFSAGFHRVSFDASGLTAGMYIYRLESKGYSASKRMTVIR